MERREYNLLKTIKLKFIEQTTHPQISPKHVRRVSNLHAMPHVSIWYSRFIFFSLLACIVTPLYIQAWWKSIIAEPDPSLCPSQNRCCLSGCRHRECFQWWGIVLPPTNLDLKFAWIASILPLLSIVSDFPTNNDLFTVYYSTYFIYWIRY